MTTPHFSRGPPPPFNLTFPPTLNHYNKPAAQWLADNDKHFNGLAASALVFSPSDRILLVQRAAHDSMPNKWEIPGGAVDASDATLLHGAARELWEETGLVGERAVQLVTEGEGRPEWSVFTNRTGAKILAKFCFEVGVGEGEVRVDPAEHQDFVWATEEEVRGGRVGEREITITARSMRAIILEGFRLRRERAGEEEGKASPAEG